MKATITSILIALFLSLSIHAQNDLTLDIVHMLGDAPFELYEPADQSSFSFEVDRLEYYVSDISITHDGGTVTDIEDVWLLVNATSDDAYALGSWDINQVESISFHIGVGPDVNNEDPAQWPPNHPLYPQLPSMHWGWASGYRFVAMEGLSGATEPNQVFEIHALGNNLYYETTVDVTSTASGGQLSLTLVADYVKALEGMNLSSGTITHGSFGVAITILENFRDEVFSPGVPSSIDDLEFRGVWDILPNPSSDQAMLMLELPSADSHTLVIRDINGRIVHAENLTFSAGRLTLPEVDSGTYLVELMNRELRITSTRWIVH